jgi:hypothetical protein
MELLLYYLHTCFEQLSTLRDRQVALTDFVRTWGDRTRFDRLGLAQFQPSSPLADVSDDNRNTVWGVLCWKHARGGKGPSSTALHTLHAPDRQPDWGVSQQ